MRRAAWWFLAVSIAGASSVRVPAQDPADPARARTPGPKLALVLSGGGARGAAHIGVLEVLEEHHIVPDLLVGTSMGAIVGGLYAAGYSPQEIEDILASIEWDDVFFDTVPRKERSFLRKQDDTPFLIPLKLRFEGLKPFLPGGLLGGQNLELFMRELVLQATHAEDFDDLPIPFRAVAMDLATSEPVVLGKGNLALAMRASMSIPGAFPPVLIDGRYLVDGGSAANLPVGIAQKLGAERIIAVNISTPLDSEVHNLSFLGVMSQLTGFLTSGSVENDRERLRSGDLLIEPDLGDITFKSFDRARDAVAIGAAAARAQSERLTAFGSSPQAWEAFERRHVRTDATRLAVEEFVVENTSWVGDRLVESQISVPTGEPLDLDRLNREIVRLKGLDYFGLSSYELNVEDGRSRLVLRTPEKPYNRGSLQFGVNFSTDFRGDATYGLLARHRVLAVNSRGGEWVNTAQIGETTLGSSEFYQPLDWSMRWFASVLVGGARTNQTLWSDGNPVAEARIAGFEGRLDVGRVLGRWGDVRLGAYRGRERADVRIGPPLFDPFSEDLGGIRGGFRVDTRNRAILPHSGARGELRIERSLDALGGEANWTFADLTWSHFLSAGRNTFVPFALGAANLSRDATLGSVAAIGGLGRLSGLGENELLGDRGGVFGLRYYYEIKGLSLGPIGSRLFAGASLEAGNVYAREDSITWDSLLHGGALFVAAETPLGPAYFGWGFADPDRERLYLAIGERF